MPNRPAPSRAVATASALAAVFWFTVAVAPTGAHEREQDHAYKASRSGQILSLETILEKLRPTIGSEIVGIETESEHGALVYEIRYLDSTGRRREIHIDARTGEPSQDAD